MKKTTYRFSWADGWTKVRRLSRSFRTQEEAERFANGKKVLDIWRSHGKYKVEWIKESTVE